MKRNVLGAVVGMFASFGLFSQSFTTGDLIPIAYRMSAVGADDEVLFVARTNIPGGIQLQFTDAKFTTNAQAQCAGGLTWTAPLTGLPAGSIISVKSDLGLVTPGTSTGTTFGLSSNGDQCLVYSGTAAMPLHITALSSKAWATGILTTCSGGNSLLPGGLNGTTAITLSTAPGNTSGNTVNAYYNGPQIGSWATLRDSIMSPARWVGVAGATAPQVWPVWNFPGPPAVSAATVPSPKTMHVIFSKSMLESSAENTANYMGIPGLLSAVMSSNGPKADTVVLTFSNSFSNGLGYALTVQNILDEQNVSLFTPYVYNFNYTTTAQFVSRSVVIKEGQSAATITLQISNPANTTVAILTKSAPFSTASANDIVLSSYLIPIGDTTTSVVFTAAAVDDSFLESDEYMVLQLNGVGFTGPSFFTVYIQDNDRIAPSLSKVIELAHTGSFQPDTTAGSSCESVAYDSTSQRMFITSSIQNRFDIVDFSSPDSLVRISSIDMTPYGGLTSISVKNGLVAVASPNPNEQLNGSVVFFNANGQFKGQVTVGALPDMICFTPDGQKVIVANEGQPASNYSVDPEGSVSIINVMDTVYTASDVTTASFAPFNAQMAQLMAIGVRKTADSSTLAQDLEPEYITVSANSQKAWVTLQENNAIAEIDLTTGLVTSIWPLGVKNMMSPGNTFDASDKGSKVLMSQWPTRHYYTPDAIANFTRNGIQYLVTANEGDERTYDALNERVTLGSISLDSTVFPNAAMLKEDHALGRLRLTNKNGDLDGDGDFDEICAMGTRSFSIWNSATGALVYDSGDDFEQYFSNNTKWGHLFNSDHEENKFKSRSRSKGPEPEGVAIAQFGSHVYAFITLERVGGVFVYLLDNPAQPVLTDYINTRWDTANGGDLGPEVIQFISPKQSPNGKPYLVVANEVSGTVSIFEVLRANLGMEEEIDFTKQLAVFPNPTQNLIRFDFQGEVVVVDALGREILKANTSGTLDVSALTSGLYIVRTSSGLTARFVKQ